MLSIKSGYDSGYLTNAVAGGREGYYTGAVAAGEPAGRWWGAGAEQLGLRGEVDADTMTLVYNQLRDPRDYQATLGDPHKAYRPPEELYADALEREPHASPERRAELRRDSEKHAKQAVAFHDATFSAPKSVTVLAVAAERAENDARAAGDERAAQAWAAHRAAIEDAVMAGATAAVEYLQDVAGYGRIGHHGGNGGRWIDSHQFVVAQFLQHDSRDRDPQLHVHQAILNRQLCSDGEWRALDRAIRINRGSAGALGERVMEAHLSRTLGVAFETRPDGKAREVVGVPQQVMDLFSSRRRAITGKSAQLMGEFREKFGRDPSPLERKHIQQQATLATRSAKSHTGETADARLERWEREARENLLGGLGEVAHNVLTSPRRAEKATWDPQDVIDRALALVAKDGETTWTRSDLTWRISDALPANLGLAPAKVRELLDSLTDKALEQATSINPADDVDLPAELRLANGRSSYRAPGADRYATPGQLAADRERRNAAIDRVAARCTTDEAQAVLARIDEAGVRLGADQAAALSGILTSGAQLQVMVAPAGSGKSFTMGQAAAAWTEHGGRVLGLAPSQISADVLSGEGVEALNLAQWRSKVEHGNAPAAELFIVDEAGMARTDDIDAVIDHAKQTGATVLLVGDDRQLAAVGPGGALSDLADRAVTHRLAGVRRFTEAWEREASLRLRDGDPVAVDAYDRHGRLIDGGTAEEAERKAGRAWLADTLAGRESVLLAGSNEAAARLSGELRAQLVELGRVQEDGVPLARDGNVAGVGDLVQARRNDWTLAAAPVNRATYRVTGVLEDGSLRVTPAAGGDERVLPKSYVEADLTLAYASTVHAAQGRTLDTAHAVLGPGQDAAAAYVAMTRGRDRNTAYAVTRTLPQDAYPGQALEVEERTARDVLAGVLERAEPEKTALAQQEEADAEARSMGTLLERFSGATAEATAGRTGRILDQLTAEGALTVEQREQLAADQAVGALDRLLRTAELAGHNPTEVLRDAATSRGLGGSASIAQVLHYRIRESDLDLSPRLTSARDLVPSGASDEMTEHLQKWADRIDERRHELGAAVAEEAPRWALEALGPVPGDPMERVDWEMRAGWAAAHREAAELGDDEVLGAAPPAGLAEKHAVWRTAHAELDLPDAGADEALMSDGQLRVRVEALRREEAWAPRWVGDELAATEQRLAERRADVELWSARADAGDQDAEQLRAAAENAEREAVELADRVPALEEVDAARASWLVETAVTRDNAERARAELGARGVSLDDPKDQVTAEEWLAAHREEQAVEDEHREITALDVVDERDEHVVDDRVEDVVETAVPDIRDTAEQDPTEHTDGGRRVPTIDETAAAVERAREALAEIEQRDTYDEPAATWEPEPAVEHTDDDALTRQL